MAVPPIRCFTCNRVLPHEKFRIEMEKCKDTPGVILDKIGCTRERHECCRGMILTSVNNDDFPVNLHTPGVLPPYVIAVPRTSKTVVIRDPKKRKYSQH